MNILTRWCYWSQDKVYLLVRKTLVIQLSLVLIGASGNTDIQGTLVVEGQTTINDSLIINAANEEFAIQNGSGTDKFTVDTDNGNTVIQGTVNIEWCY